MKLAGYQQWVEVFDENISKSWMSERKEFQKAAMLYVALDRELQNIRNNLEEDFLQLKEKMEEKDSQAKKSSILECKLDPQKTVNSKNKENRSPNVNSVMKQNLSGMESPDLFRNINNLHPTDAAFIDLSISDEEKTKLDKSVPNIQTSPTIKSKYKKNNRLNNTKKQKVDSTESKCRKDIFQKDMDQDMSVIDCTPETNRTKSDIKKTKMMKNKKKTNNSSTLTQMFSTSMKRKVKPSDNKNKLESSDCDKSYYEENSDEEPMHLTDLLNYINNDEHMEMDYAEDNPQTNNISKKPRIENMEPEPVVRGLARKQLKGFSCEQCRKFYSPMNLPPEQLQKLIDECSKHLYKYNPPEDTVPGFWDLSFDAPPN